MYENLYFVFLKFFFAVFGEKQDYDKIYINFFNNLKKN